VLLFTPAPIRVDRRDLADRHECVDRASHAHVAIDAIDEISSIGMNG
jgi:hypothetical protein